MNNYLYSADEAILLGLSLWPFRSPKGQDVHRQIICRERDAMLSQFTSELGKSGLAAVAMQLACFNSRDLPSFQRSAQQRYQDNSAKG